MKTMVNPSRWSFGLLVLALSAAPLMAQSANGSFTFTTGGSTKTIEFNAKQGGNGSQMTFSGAADFPEQDVDGEGNAGTTGTVANLTISVKFDCIRVTGNRAAMSGVVTSSSVPAYVGRRGTLAVEDNGEGSKNGTPDRFTWGLYGNSAMSWTPSDAELVFDDGWSYSWIAYDAERNDDAGIPGRPGESVNCQTFPLSSYSLEDIPHGAGNIQVKP